MAESVSQSDRRPQTVAMLGFLLQMAAFGVLLYLALAFASAATMSVARLVFAGFPIWIVLFLVFKQLRRVRSEQLEAEEMKRARASTEGSALFEMDEEALYLEQNKLRWIIRWLLPGTTVLVVAIALIGHFVLWGWETDVVWQKALRGEGLPSEQPMLIMWVSIGVGFLCFLFARYTLALSRLPDWRLLRAGAMYMAGNAMACLILSVALMASGTIEWLEPLVAVIVRVFLLVLAFEFLLNWVLDFYRPRAAGMVSRPSFDSRILGLVGEPGGIARSIADAINYQFGFEVSSTWFYQLLQRWLFPVTVLTAAIVMALSSVVVVQADEQVVVERFGRPSPRDHEFLDPGVHFKLPYPFERIYRTPVRRIREVVIGEQLAGKNEDDHEHEAVIWTEEHEYVPELMLLVASGGPVELPELAERVDVATGDDEGVPVSLLMVSVPIEYRVKDVRDYLYNYDNPGQLLEAIAYQYLSDYAASVDIDTLMGPGRREFNGRLKTLIQERLDVLECGIEVVFVGVRGAHPPAKDGVAAAFQSAIAAETNMDSLIFNSQSKARTTLIEVAGSEARALELDEALVARNRLRAAEPVDAEALAQAEARVADLLLGSADGSVAPTSGEAAAMIADARTRARNAISAARSKLRAFSTEVAAYQAAPNLYMERRLLDVYRELDHVRKYVLIGDTENINIVYETIEPPGLDKVLSDSVEKEKARQGGRM